ncbi:MAG: hypothetical protein ABJD07_00420 [Gemmatimonadaceae bacterium]
MTLCTEGRGSRRASILSMAVAVAAWTAPLAAHDDMPFPDGVNGYLLREMLAAIDGARSGLDLYRLVTAEVREAGTEYYRSISPEITLDWMRSIERLRLIKQR